MKSPHCAASSCRTVPHTPSVKHISPCGHGRCAARPGGRCLPFRPAAPAKGQAGMCLHTGPCRRQGAARWQREGRPRTKAGIHLLCAAQHFQSGLIRRCAPALKIGGAGLVRTRALVPYKAQPAQVIHKLVCILRAAAGGVQVFNAQNKAPAAAFYRQPRQKRRQRVAQMHAPRGAGRKAPHRRRVQCPPAPFTSMAARRSTDSACSAGTAESGTGFTGA